MLSGDEIWCQFFSEPEAGSDLAGIRTRATRDGDHWILNGSKIWSSGAYYADWACAWPAPTGTSPKHRGLTWFAVPTDAPGVTVQPITQINGNAEFCEEFLDDVDRHRRRRDRRGQRGLDRGPDDARLRAGRRRARRARALDTPRALAPDLVELARRVGRADDPVARQAIARAHINDFAQFHLAAGCWRRPGGRRPNPTSIAAYSKLAAGTFTPERARLALEIGGGAALRVGRGVRQATATPPSTTSTARGHSIAGGTNEMQRNGIGERVLGLPREPSFDVDRPFAEVVRRGGGQLAGQQQGRAQGETVKFHWFAQQYYTQLPPTTATRVRSSWVTPPAAVADPAQVGRDYHMYLRLMQRRRPARLGLACSSTSTTRPRWR